MNPINQGLIMTAIGMGLVFIAILALWWLMDVMVKLTNDRPKKEINAAPVSEATETEPQDQIQVETVSDNRLRQVAAAAVAIAIQLQKQRGSHTRPNNADLSAWQLTRRSSILSQTPNLINRKSRGSVQ